LDLRDQRVIKAIKGILVPLALPVQRVILVLPVLLV
jgi:hypothetical protein